MSWLACGGAAACGGALLLLWPPAGWVLRVRLGPRQERRLRGWSIGPLARGGLVLSGVVVALVTSRPSFAIVAATFFGAGLFVLRQVQASHRRKASLHTRADAISALELLAAELRAGILPGSAIAALADDAPFLRPAAVAASHGGDVVAALRGG